jgi:tetratricopeptide (TPR) repeat protein
MQELQSKHQDCSETHFRKAVELSPESAKYRGAYANLLLLKGNVDGAIAQLEEALATGERPALLLSNLGVALKMAGRIDEAVVIHEEAVAAAPQDVDTLFNASVCFMAKDMTEKVLSILNQILELDAEHAYAHFHLARYEGAAGGDQVFLKHLEVAGLSAALRPNVLLLKAVHFHAKGDAKAWQDELRTAFDLDPELIGTIEQDDVYVSLRDTDFYKDLLSTKPAVMYACFTEAKRSSRSDDVEQKAFLVVLVKARHAVEAGKAVQQALTEAGWSKFNLANLAPAIKENLGELGEEAAEGWRQAEENGKHVLVF